MPLFIAGTLHQDYVKVALIRLRLIAVQFADDNRYTSLMEPFEYEGIFWLPVKDNVQLAGRLKFDAAEGATLNLMGGFGAIQEQFSDQARMIRMHGWPASVTLPLTAALILIPHMRHRDHPSDLLCQPHYYGSLVWRRRSSDI